MQSNLDVETYDVFFFHVQFFYCLFIYFLFFNIFFHIDVLASRKFWVGLQYVSLQMFLYIWCLKLLLIRVCYRSSDEIES